MAKYTNIKMTPKLQSLIKKGRFIPNRIYCELKKQKICDFCHQTLEGEIPEIHHIIGIADGGTNERNNLMVVHKVCHAHIEKRKNGNIKGRSLSK
jgi:5-methylcytosine-specific restriction endonuclease McrA